jgi:hypothetical protein
LTESCRQLRRAIAPLGPTLCSALDTNTNINGRRCASVHHGVFEFGQQFIRLVRYFSGGRPEKRVVVVGIDKRSLMRHWLGMAKALGTNDLVLSAQDFSSDALVMIIKEASAAAVKRQHQRGMDDAGRAPKRQVLAKRTRNRSATTTAIIRCFQRGMSDRQQIATAAGCSVGQVSTTKMRYSDECLPIPKTKTQSRRKR